MPVKYENRHSFSLDSASDELNEGPEGLARPGALHSSDSINHKSAHCRARLSALRHRLVRNSPCSTSSTKNRADFWQGIPTTRLLSHRNAGSFYHWCSQSPVTILGHAHLAWRPYGRHNPCRRSSLATVCLSFPANTIRFDRQRRDGDRGTRRSVSALAGHAWVTRPSFLSDFNGCGAGKAACYSLTFEPRATSQDMSGPIRPDI